MAREHGVSPPEESGAEKALTPIHRGIHCGATPDTTEGGNELDLLAVDALLDTLVDVALAIAARKVAKYQRGDQVA